MRHSRVKGTDLKSLPNCPNQELTPKYMWQFEQQELIARGDKVVTLARHKWRAKGTGCKFEEDWAPVFTSRRGMIAAF